MEKADEYVGQVNSNKHEYNPLTYNCQEFVQNLIFHASEDPVWLKTIGDKTSDKFYTVSSALNYLVWSQIWGFFLMFMVFLLGGVGWLFTIDRDVSALEWIFGIYYWFGLVRNSIVPQFLDPLGYYFNLFNSYVIHCCVSVLNILLTLSLSYFALLLIARDSNLGYKPLKKITGLNLHESWFWVKMLTVNYFFYYICTRHIFIFICSDFVDPSVKGCIFCCYSMLVQYIDIVSTVDARSYTRTYPARLVRNLGNIVVTLKKTMHQIL